MVSNALSNAFAAGNKQPLGQRFQRNNQGWFVDEGGEIHGPYHDKADAQTALMYYSLKSSWPTEKQLRQFFQIGK